MKKIDNILKINCDCADTLKLEEMTEFQGGLKQRKDEDYDKIIKSIKKHGFSFPFYVWKHDGINHILDGHGRYGALKILDERGFLIPALPVVYVNCKDDEQARDLLLRLNSDYGKMSKESVVDFIGDYDFDLGDYNLPSCDIDFSAEDIDPLKDMGLEPEKKNKMQIVLDFEDETEMDGVYYKLIELGFNPRMVK